MREGFLFVGHNASEPMASARAGDRVTRPGLGPPWLVMNHTVERVLITGTDRSWRSLTARLTEQGDLHGIAFSFRSRVDE